MYVRTQGDKPPPRSPVKEPDKVVAVDEPPKHVVEERQQQQPVVVQRKNTGNAQARLAAPAGPGSADVKPPPSRGAPPAVSEAVKVEPEGDEAVSNGGSGAVVWTSERLAVLSEVAGSVKKELEAGAEEDGRHERLLERWSHFHPGDTLRDLKQGLELVVANDASQIVKKEQEIVCNKQVMEWSSYINLYIAMHCIQ